MVTQFEDTDTRSISECKELMEKESLKCDLAFIKCHLSFLPHSITRLETAGLSLLEAIGIIEDVKKRLDDLPDTKGKVFKEKMEQVLEKNSTFKTFQEVAKVYSGETSSMLSGWSPEEIAELKYCRMTSVDVERSFSAFKHVFNDRRHSFKESNLEKVVVSNCFYNRKQ